MHTVSVETLQTWLEEGRPVIITELEARANRCAVS